MKITTLLLAIGFVGLSAIAAQAEVTNPTSVTTTVGPVASVTATSVPAASEPLVTSISANAAQPGQSNLLSASPQSQTEFSAAVVKPPTFVRTPMVSRLFPTLMQ
jgi:hypothetical protein